MDSRQIKQVYIPQQAKNRKVAHCTQSPHQSAAQIAVRLGSHCCMQILLAAGRMQLVKLRLT